MKTLDTARDWVPGAPTAVLDRAHDALDVDLSEVAGDVLDVAGDLVEAAGEGLVAAVAATEVASQATAKLFRRHPWLAGLVAGSLILGVVMIVRKRRSADDDAANRSLHVAA